LTNQQREGGRSMFSYADLRGATKALAETFQEIKQRELALGIA